MTELLNFRTPGLLHLLSQESEHLSDSLYTCDQLVYFFLSVVEGKGSPHRAEHTKAIHKRLGTMVTGAYGNAQLVEQCTHIHMMDVAHIE